MEYQPQIAEGNYKKSEIGALPISVLGPPRRTSGFALSFGSATADFGLRPQLSSRFLFGPAFAKASADLRLWVLGFGLFLPGCAGPTTLTLIPLSTHRLSPDAPLQFELKPQECYWWLDEEGRIQLAIGYENLSLFGDYTRNSLKLSIVLDKPPAGEAREYSVRRDAARGLWDRGPFHLRLRSRRGIVAVEKVSETVIRGRYRLFCGSQRYDVLTGWRRQTSVLVQGRFKALRDKNSGQAILDRIAEALPQRENTAKITFER